MSSGASGMDLYADVKNDIILTPGQIKLISAGIYVSIPQKYEAQIRPRSGLAYKHGLTVLNTPGTIDADYRGEIKVILVNLSNEQYLIKAGERIAQMVVTAHSQADWHEVTNLAESERNEGGFGSTGTK